jgi:NADH dehydrogenase
MVFFWKRRTHTTDKRQRIVILGGGFAGVYTALRLDKTLARDTDIEIVLVSRDNFLLFTPMLHEVATGEIGATDIVNALRKMLRRVNLFIGEVESIDLPGKRVTVSHGDSHHHHELAYEYLVLALGASTNFFNLPGLQERALTMKSINDALHLRNHVIKNLGEADFECCTDLRETLLTVVVAGAGFAGVETIGGLNDFVRESLRFYPHLKEDMVRFLLVDAGPAILPELSPSLGAYAQKKLARRKIEILLSTKVESVADQEVKLSNGTSIRTNTLIWTGGNAPHPLLSALPCQMERGRPLVNDFLEIPEWPGVWAVGDCAAIHDPCSGKLYPPTAQHALRQGKVLARNLEATIRGGVKTPFVFSMLGQLAAIGKRTGVANILGVNFSGFVAWFLWRSIYLSKLPRLEKKIRVALNWTLDLFFSKDLVRISTARAPAIAQQHGAECVAGATEDSTGPRAPGPIDTSLAGSAICHLPSNPPAHMGVSPTCASNRETRAAAEARGRTT